MTIQERIMHLLRKTTGAGCTEAEAESAAGAAQRLMVQHRITEASLGNDEPDRVNIDEDTMFSQGTTLASWRGFLAVAVGNANGCTVWREGPALRIAGPPAQVKLAVYLFVVLSRTVDNLTEVNAVGRGRGYIAGYRRGVVQAIGKRLRQESQSAMAGAGSTALVHIRREDAALALHMADHHGNLGRGRVGSVDRGGFRAGQQDGAGATWNKGMTGGAARVARKALA